MEVNLTAKVSRINNQLLWIELKVSIMPLRSCMYIHQWILWWWQISRCTHKSKALSLTGIIKTNKQTNKKKKHTHINCHYGIRPEQVSCLFNFALANFDLIFNWATQNFHCIIVFTGLSSVVLIQRCVNILTSYA